jgi:hypothetical protein
MKVTKKAQELLKEIAQIHDMERGKICKMRGRRQLNHQTWREGRNVVRYVRSDDVEKLQKAIDGYERFKKLMEQYADEIIRLSRSEREAEKRKREKEAI